MIGEVLYSSGASVGPKDRDLDGCTSCDGDFDSDVTFYLQTCLVCGLDLGVVGLLFSTSPSSSFFGS
jgi:hypothetical protein